MEHNRELGICTLNHIGNSNLSSIWRQKWPYADDLGLAINWLEDWAHFTSALRLAHVHIREAEDELVWYFPNAGGKYSTKMGYQVLINIENGDNCWWYKPMWSLKGPLKAKLFFWLILQNRVLTWERIQCRGKHSPGYCYLRKNSDESSVHLFFNCEFSREVWRVIAAH